MASTYTSNNGIEKPGSGEQSGTWGATTNTNFDIIDRAINGVATITLTGTTKTLTTTDGAMSEGHYRTIIFDGTPTGAVTVTISPNDQSKTILVNNSCGQNITFTQGTGGDVTINDGTSAWIYADGAGAGAQIRQVPSDVVNDTTPQLGGDLDVQTHSIVSTSNQDINITPNGTGTVVVGTDLDVDNINIDGNTIISTDTNGDINITPNGTGSVVLDGLSHPQADGTAGQVLATDGSGQLSFTSSPSALSFYPKDIRILRTGNFTIPSGAKAVWVKASGGGGGGAGTGGGDNGSIGAGGNGGSTTVTNTTLGISVTAGGGRGGSGSSGNAHLTTGSGGDVIYKAGAGGGEAGEHGSNNDWRFSGQDGHPANVVSKFVTNASAGGEVLTISYGAGGTAGTGGGSYGQNPGAAGAPGYVEIWVW